MNIYSSASQQSAVQIERIDPNRLGKVIVEKGGTRAFLKFIECALGPGLANNTCWSEIIDQFIAPSANGALAAMQEKFQLSQKDRSIFYSVTSCENTPAQASRSVRIFSQDRDVDPIVDSRYQQFSASLKPSKANKGRVNPKNYVELPEDMRSQYGTGSFSYKK